MSRLIMNHFNITCAYIMNDLYEYRGTLSWDDLFWSVHHAVQYHSSTINRRKHGKSHSFDENDFILIRNRIIDDLLTSKKS
ncbi:hypothetical protein [Solibacillus daqui]|uniref:hypothetical protein n=1 Tax=Solibacillus daqui TaxID=2912187 RepID=UPI002365CFDA|nr:hypothetical protein [Solibacillus daqui]